MTRRGWLLFAAMAVIWGIPYLLIRIAVGEITPAVLVFLRTGIGTALLLPFVVRSGGFAPLLPRWKWVMAYTVAEVAVPWFLLFDAERRLSSSLAGLLIAAVPSVGALLAWLTGGDDRPDARRVAGLVVGFAGVAAVVGVDVSAADLGAIGEVLVVTVGYAIGPMLIARKLSDLPSLAVVAASLALAALAYAPLAIAQWPARLPAPAVLASVAILSVVCTAVAFVVFFALVGEAGPARATVITYVNPAVALVLGVLLLGEPFTAAIAAGFVLIVLGSFFATRRARAGREPAAPAQAAPRADR